MGHIVLPKGMDVNDKASMAYKVVPSHRDSLMTFEKGKQVFILDDPKGNPWIMQAFSAELDPTLTYDSLASLGAKLKPPPGWKFRVATLDRDLTIKAVNGVANIIQDELQNTYDECFQDACTYNP